MIPVPTTELVVEDRHEVTVISHHQGICKAATLNQTGYAIWKLIDGKKSIGEITELFILTSLNGINHNFQVVSNDILTFITKLEEKGFVYFLPFSNKQTDEK